MKKLSQTLVGKLTFLGSANVYGWCVDADDCIDVVVTWDWFDLLSIVASSCNCLSAVTAGNANSSVSVFGEGFLHEKMTKVNNQIIQLVCSSVEIFLTL